MIHINEKIYINEAELSFNFIRASGPGGQNVNKVSSAVQLRFDVIHCPSLPENVKEKLIKLSGKQITRDGVLIIHSKQFRTQEQNRKETVNRLIILLRKASVKPKRRIKTRPGKKAVEERLKEKHHQSEIKKRRQFKPDMDN